MKIKTGVMIRPVKGDLDKTPYTRWWVRGDEIIYEVRVDSGGLWSCDCPGATFRGYCYHINMVKSEIERVKILNGVEKIMPVKVSREDFEAYLAQPRFLCEPWYSGPRQFMFFGKFVYLGKVRMDRWETPTSFRLAGTLLEGLWDRHGRRKAGDLGAFYLTDLLMWKGIDYRLSPLAFRKEMLSKVIKEIGEFDDIKIGRSEWSEEGKKEMLIEYTERFLVLKDCNSPYILEGRSPRAWLMLAGGYSG